MLPSLEVIVGIPQASVADAPGIDPNGSAAAETQPRSIGVFALVKTGGVTSAVQVTVREAVDVLPQKSLAVNVLV
jgi:hypothetical protein